ncbi:uncharacterized protein BT62DRAFT_915562 [Guyanagaster necrorhizus]|uniref:Zn(2)-C6 fungal-type domain-containing protein n=1 Tax=Guyanagaster necrorhizus TaxID=856835 RepID=A0A9P7W349_9AGAR|nr:uncharacterized protein BT62DRAFT_915553 [Guyanagaster necrorhizus MCA 3950]XP_043045204.1 uncharacterized protein BT62DRAFT_915562 [Guyanagaster necrorhizus MCA 3950]KAG7451690.1 hypothetical protein BT62DRAFT_915553 [Guyanagaster necrorhizus MCA 3950]KAG7451704.1 hypothetical protein BT62DRAFT_915562 [Guyanagaster necrorhizus MCA 3950]
MLKYGQCDENHPTCENCTRRGIACVWSNTVPKRESPVPAGGRSALLVGQSSSSSNELSLSTWTGASSSDSLILELMHHYSISASYSLSSDPDASRVWSIVVPKMAFDPSNQCLLHAILAISALHIHHTDPTAPPRYAAAARTFYHQAKIDLDDDSADINAALVALSLVGRYEFASSAKLCPLSSGDSDWYITTCAVRRNIAKRRTELQDTVFQSLLGAMAPDNLPTSLEEPFPSSLSTILSTAPDVEELRDASVHVAYVDSIHVLEIAWRASLNRCMGTWWYWMSHTFFRLLEEERPRALVILAHYCVMMKHVTRDGPWWMKKQWDREAARIVTMLDERWAPWLGWLESQLDEKRDGHVFDFTGVDILTWLSAGDGDHV